MDTREQRDTDSGAGLHRRGTWHIGGGKHWFWWKNQIEAMYDIYER